MKISKQKRADIYNESHSHQTIKNMAYKDSAPYFVSIVGPPGSGKSTLYRSILESCGDKKLSESIKNISTKDGRKATGYSCINEALSSLFFPTTISLGNKRFSFYDSDNNLDNVVDCLKVSDIVIFTICDKLEKEIFEFINMINAQGVIKMLFVYSSREKTNSSKTRLSVRYNEIVKRLSQEFTYKIKPTRLEYSNGIYTNIFDIGLRSIKVRPVEWKCNNPHIVVDKIRMKDLNGVSVLRDQKSTGIFENRNLTELCAQSADTVFILSGYLRGASLSTDLSTKFCVPSIGMLSGNDIYSIKAISDPTGDDFRGIYAPMIEEQDVDIDVSDAEQMDFSNDEYSIFPQPEKVYSNTKYEEENIQTEESSNDCLADEVYSSVDKEDMSDTADRSEYESIDRLKNKLSNRFRSLNDEEDLIEKFEERFDRSSKKSNNSKGSNFLIESKKKELDNMKELEQITESILPGNYVEISINQNTYNKIIAGGASLLLLGAYALSSHHQSVLLEGSFRANKWFFKSNHNLEWDDYCSISIGWHRIYSKIAFSNENLIIDHPDKKLTNIEGILFNGPNCKGLKNYYIYNKNSEYRIIGSGKIEEVNNGCVSQKIQKKSLIGYVKNSTGNNSIIKGMFNSSKEVEKFANGKIVSKSGIRGIIKSSIGKYGEFRGTFEGNLLVGDRIELVLRKKYEDTRKYKILLEKDDTKSYPAVRNVVQPTKATLDIGQKTSLCYDGSSLESDPILNKLNLEIESLKKQIPFYKEETTIEFSDVKEKKRKEDEERQEKRRKNAIENYKKKVCKKRKVRKRKA